MGLLSRIFAPAQVKQEGEYRPGPWLTMDGWLPESWGQYANWWQLGYDPIRSPVTSIVEACVSAYAQTIAMCPGAHWRRLDNGGRELVDTSALSRILRKPNSYQSSSDFLLNLVRGLYLEGNAYALALRNSRFEIAELHLFDPRQCRARVGVDGSIFYSLGGNEIVERLLTETTFESQALLAGVPARDVLHVKLHTPRHPLCGETPLASAQTDLAVSGAMSSQAIAFAANQSRPSGVLSTDNILSKAQMDELRAAWESKSQGMNAGRVPILAAGLKWQAMGVNAHDAQLVEQLKLTETHIAQAFRMPLQVLGLGGTTFASTELLMQFWIATGLGFALNHVEVAFDAMFGLYGPPWEYTEFDTAVLLRSAYRDRIEGLARGVQSGIYAPNEARAAEELAAVEFGDEPRVQAQVVPLSAAQGIPSAPSAQPAPTASTPEGDEDEPEPEPEPEKGANDNERILRAFRSSHARHLAF
jgi:HK97 family phage portal protein